MVTKADLQKLCDNLAPISKQKPSDDLIDLACRLKAVEEETQTSAAAIEIWHQAILLSQTQLKQLQP
jgi:hypothetical protein